MFELVGLLAKQVSLDLTSVTQYILYSSQTDVNSIFDSHKLVPRVLYHPDDLLFTVTELSVFWEKGAGILWSLFTVELAAIFLALVSLPTLGGTISSDISSSVMCSPHTHQSPNMDGSGSSSLLDCCLFLSLASSPHSNL